MSDDIKDTTVSQTETIETPQEAPEQRADVFKSLATKPNGHVDQDLEEKFRAAADKLKPVLAEPPHELTDIEKKAVEMGWDPTGEKAKKANKRHKTAEEFVDNRSFLDAIEKRNKEIDQLKELVRGVSEQLTKTQQQAQQKHLEELNAKRLDAIKKSDVEAVAAIEAKMMETHQTTQAVTQPVPVQQPVKTQEMSPVAKDFISRNQGWFNNNPENVKMVNYTIACDELLALKMPHLSEVERIKLVETDVRKTFPDRFNDELQNAPAAVTTKSEKVSPSRNTGARNLSDSQRQIGEQLVERGVFKNLDAYAQKLAKIGALRND